MKAHLQLLYVSILICDVNYTNFGENGNRILHVKNYLIAVI